MFFLYLTEFCDGLQVFSQIMKKLPQFIRQFLESDIEESYNNLAVFVQFVEG